MKLFLRGITLLTSLLFLYLHCASKEFIYSKFIVGAPCEVKFYYGDDRTAKEIIDVIDLELTRLDSLLSFFSDHSLVSELNQESRVKAPSDVIYLISLSDSISELTNGLFDISIAPLLEIWGFYKHKLNIPDTIEIDKTKKLVNYKKIQIKGDSIIIPNGMKIDLGGIAQGYAAERVAMILRQRHVKSAIINIGGEIIAIGKSPENRPWHIGIRNPRGEGVIETVELEDGAVSTSGDYEKFFIIDNKRYPHIIDPKKGFPALEFASVTIFSKDAAYADAIATAVSIMGPDKGMKFLDSLGIRGIIYYEENDTLKRRETK
jgi:thiamine biosynthesis lipoprotein